MAAGLLVVAGACGDDGDQESAGADDAPEAPEAPEPEETTTTTLSPEDEVLAAYEASTDAVAAAYDPPDPEHPQLLASFDGVGLARHQANLTTYQGQGVSEVATHSDIEASVTALSGDTATVRACIDETTEIIDTETRDRVDGPLDRSAHMDVQLERIDGDWKLVDGQQLEEPC